ncbi:MAG: sodium-dependent transporter [Campylobacteraceae bacterium 4484_4]|nr:MAG: sodium-dependent transporter [Campylobacteraceae bacterium 4484_4]
MTHARFSRIGFILASAGAAVGLGNIWKFPYITGVYGGGAFVLVYLVTILLIGFSLLTAEMLIGKRGGKDCISSFEHIAPVHKGGWKLAGFMLFNGLIIMTFYSVVIGWIFYYIFLTFKGLPTSPEEAKTTFNILYGERPWLQIGMHLLSTVIVAGVLLRGLKKGIEKTNLVLMPMLIMILGGLLIYSMQFESFHKALAFMFAPDFSKLSSEAIIRAVGHSFFTLSIGVGSIMTYASALPKHASIVRAGFWVAFLDTFIALMAGVMIFAFLFQFGGEPAKGPGLVFMSLPVIFSSLGTVGTVIALFFFLGLAFAGLTSAISLVEPTVMYLEDRRKWSRKGAVILSSLLYFIVGVFVIFSISDGYKEMLTFGKHSLFDVIEFTTDSILLPLAGILIALFVGYVMNREEVKHDVKEAMGETFFAVWLFSLRIIVPLAVIFLVYNAFNAA